MSSIALIDHVYSPDNTDQFTLHNHTSGQDEYKQKLLEKVENDQRNGKSSSFLDTLEELRNEQRVRLAQVEHDYYNQKETTPSFDVHHHAHEHEKLVTSKPPLPKASRQSPSPALFTEERAQHHNQHPMSASIVRRHDDEIAFCPHRTMTGSETTTVHDLTTNHIHNQIKSMWNEFELEDYLEQKKTRRSPAAASWAGRITIPAPFALTNSVNVDSVHHRKCMHDVEVSKLQKEFDDEVNLRKSFKAKPVPAHVHMPLYDRLQEEQLLRREQVRHMTKEYLTSISKPFGFDSREKAKKILRRHSYSGADTLRPEPHFKAKPLPDFYSQGPQENDEMTEKTLYRSIRKKMRAKELLEQSRLPFSSPKSKRPRRSMSVTDLARSGYHEYSFKPKINGYYVPNYDKLHSKFLRDMEQTKRTRSPTRCKPFLLYTNLIPSKKDQILNDIRNDAQVKHAQTFQIKGKPMVRKSASSMSLSASLQQPESIPTKMTEAQRLREAVGKKKRRDEEGRTQHEENFQQSKSAKERRVREKIRETAKLQDQAVVSKAKRDVNTRQMRQQMRQSEDEYAKKLDAMHERVRQRPLLLEQDSKQKAVRELERKIQHAMNIANVSEQELTRQQFNSSNA